MPYLISFLGEVALRSTLVLVVAFSLLRIMRRASASERHIVMVLGLFITVLVPAGLLLSPKITWTISVPRHVESSVPTQKMVEYFLPERQNSIPPISSPLVETRSSLLDAFTVTNGLISLIVGGMLVQMQMLLRAVWTWRIIRHCAVKAILADDVLERVHAFVGTRSVPPILASNQISVPLLSGWLRPAIILPARSANWSSERLAMAVCHELAHYRRGDSQLLPLSSFLRVFYWWHPLVWLALVRLKREREAACDDFVLNQNFRASDYADLIVSTARQAQTLHWQRGALAMASSSNVGDRVLAILDPKLNRRSTSRTTIFTGPIIAFVLGWIFVAAQVQADDPSLGTDLNAAENTSKPQIYVEFKLVEIDEQTYEQQTAAIDEAVKNGDLGFLVKLHGASVISSPSVTTQSGLKVDISMEKEILMAQKSARSPGITITTANGNLTNTTTTMTTPGPTKEVLGVNFHAKPSLSPSGRILIPLWYQLTEIYRNKNGVNDLGIGTSFNVPHGLINLSAADGKAYGYWMGKEHNFSLLERLQVPNGQVETLPPLTPSANRLALIVTAHRVAPAESQNQSQLRGLRVTAQVQTEDRPVASNSTLISNLSKPRIHLNVAFAEIDEKTYQQQTAAVDEAVKNGDIAFLTKPSRCFYRIEPKCYHPSWIKGEYLNGQRINPGR